MHARAPPRCKTYAMSIDAPAGTDSGPPEPISVLAELVARHRPDSRRIRQLIALLTAEPMNLAALIQRSALPRKTVESVLSALNGDLSRSGDQVRIRPGQADAYRHRFGYEQLLRTELGDPLSGRLPAGAPGGETISPTAPGGPPP